MIQLTLSLHIDGPIPMTLALANKDLKAKGQRHHIWTHFKALFRGVLMAAADFSRNFLYPNL